MRSLDDIYALVDEFGLAMRDNARQPGTMNPAEINQLRQRVRDAIDSLVNTDGAHEDRVDRAARALSGGKPITEGYEEINPETGQQKGYVVLTPGERAKGFVRPVRSKYEHKTCGAVTTMSSDIAETYARDPKFYSGTFCIGCRKHFPLAQFVWDGTNEVVGS